MKFDKTAFRYDLSTTMDGYEKDNMPYRAPWESRSEARADASNYYNEVLEDSAEQYGIPISRARTAGAWILSGTLDSIRDAFDEYL